MPEYSPIIFSLLTVSNIVSAHMNGAVCLNYVKYTGSSVINNENVAKLKDIGLLSSDWMAGLDKIYRLW